MSANYEIAGIAENCASINADGAYIYLAVLDGDDSDIPKLLRIPADLSDIAIEVYDPTGGTRLNVMCSDITGEFVVISGDYGSGLRLSTAEDGVYFYTDRDIDSVSYWYYRAEPLLVGPGNDDVITTFTDMGDNEQWATMHTSYWVDGGLYWIDSVHLVPVGAVTRSGVQIDNSLTGGELTYWYDEAGTIFYSPNDKEFTDLSFGLDPIYWVTTLEYGT
jgi:hypothetical protein